MQVLAVYLAYHRALGEGSKWAAWIAVMPKVIECVANWGPAELSQLQDPSFQAIAEQRDEELGSVSTTVWKTLTERHASLFPPTTFSVEYVRWGLQTVSARAYGRRLAHAALVPLADAFNHANVSVKYGLDVLNPVVAVAPAIVDRVAMQSSFSEEGIGCFAPHSPMSSVLTSSSDDKRVLFADSGAASAAAAAAVPSARIRKAAATKAPAADRYFRLWNTSHSTYTAGTQVYNSYGRRDNRHLALEYGFVIADNHWEHVLCRPGGLMDIGPPPKLSIPARIRSLLVKAGLTYSEYYIRWNRWAEECMPYFRALTLNEEEIAYMERRPLPYV